MKRIKWFELGETPWPGEKRISDSFSESLFCGSVK